MGPPRSVGDVHACCESCTTVPFWDSSSRMQKSSRQTQCNRAKPQGRASQYETDFCNLHPIMTIIIAAAATGAPPTPPAGPGPENPLVRSSYLPRNRGPDLFRIAEKVEQIEVGEEYDIVGQLAGVVRE